MPTYVVFFDGLAAAPKKHKQKSDLFFYISLELFNNALFGQEIFVGLGRRLSSSAMLLLERKLEIDFVINDYLLLD